jgi:hypothetical protein
MVLIGTPAERETAVIFNARLIDQLIRHASCPVHIVPLGPDREPSRAAPSFTWQDRSAHGRSTGH